MSDLFLILDIHFLENFGLMLVKGSVEDYIYILVGVLWIAFSIYKGIQKKKSQKKRTEEDHEYDAEPEPEKKKSAFETFIDGIMVEEEETVPYKPAAVETPSEPSPTYKPQEDSNTFSYDDYYEESNYQEGLSVYDKADTQSTVLDTKLKTSQKKSRKPRFDLKKAVIYSEILNRRYF